MYTERKIKMKKTAGIILFLLTMLCMSATSFALTDGDWEYQLVEDHSVITQYTGSDENVVIPSALGGVPVTEVTCEKNSDSYFNNGVTKSITFPSSVKVIDKMCYGSDTLETVVLPEGVEEIAENAFTGCKNLKNITIPSTVKEIGGAAFANCSSLTSITLPAALEKLDGGAFLESGLVTADMSACTNLQSMDTGVFRDCEALQTIVLPNNLDKITRDMFAGCVSLSDIDIPKTVSLIDFEAFYGCTSLKSVILPTSLNELGRYAFRECSQLEEVIIPYGTVKVDAAFQRCPALKAVYVPDSVIYFSLDILQGSSNAIIYCTSDSEAAEVCREHDISFLTDSSVNTAINVLYNGKRMSFDKYGKNPEVINDRTLVPLRSIFESMNATVDWDGTTNTVTSTRGDVTMTITIGAQEIYKNGEAIPVDVPAQLINGFTMVPVRFIAEAFDASVDWNGNGNIVYINE